MNFDDFKNLINNNERLIFIEDGKPSYVVVSFEDYKKMSKVKNDNANQGLQLPERSQANEIIDTMPLPEDIERDYQKDLKLEDLPY